MDRHPSSEIGRPPAMPPNAPSGVSPSGVAREDPAASPQARQALLHRGDGDTCCVRLSIAIVAMSLPVKSNLRFKIGNPAGEICELYLYLSHGVPPSFSPSGVTSPRPHFAIAVSGRYPRTLCTQRAAAAPSSRRLAAALDTCKSSGRNSGINWATGVARAGETRRARPMAHCCSLATSAPRTSTSSTPLPHASAGLRPRRLCRWREGWPPTLRARHGHCERHRNPPSPC